MGYVTTCLKKGCKIRFYKPEPHCFWGKNCKKIIKMYKRDKI